MNDNRASTADESTEPPERALLRSLLASLQAASAPAVEAMLPSPTPASPAWGDGNPRAQAIAHPAHSRMPAVCPAALSNDSAADTDLLPQ
eukprot:CAMPEP_0172165960 /NCGR_PEP_ID=MMETSP1050-20130122/8704_1 /TAXON_ID=233186 /ORGANISM="Cryptomonas curvata, Strain CCAP979/52" /LENGTH=89 /DNA_ID=CAMNT_0012836493 /DNA_START=211 /DNA_END=477 /DNA_ORIENTATION=+